MFPFFKDKYTKIPLKQWDLNWLVKELSYIIEKYGAKKDLWSQAFCI